MNVKNLRNQERKRWRVTVKYHVTEKETRVQIIDIDELDELSQHIENGPHFGAIYDIRIQYKGGEKTNIKEALSQ